MLCSCNCDTVFAKLQEKEQPAFHDSEFPALGGVLRSANVGIPNGDRPNSLDGSNIYAHIGVHKGLLPSEFNIQSEEFPALPGATGREADGRQTDQQSTNANQVCPYLLGVPCRYSSSPLSSLLAMTLP